MKRYVLFVLIAMTALSQDVLAFPKIEPYKSEDVPKPKKKITNEDIRKAGLKSFSRFLQVDRYAEKYPSMNPYTGMGNNPIFYTDPTGDTIDVSGIMGNEKAMEAFAAYIGTKEGRKQLSQFAYAGQAITIGGKKYTFTKAGKSSTSNLNFKVGGEAETITSNSIHGNGILAKEGTQNYDVIVDIGGTLSNVTDDFFHETQHAQFFETDRSSLNNPFRVTNNTASDHHARMMMEGWKPHEDFIQQANRHRSININAGSTWEYLYNSLGDRIRPKAKAQKMFNKQWNRIKSYWLKKGVRF